MKPHLLACLVMCLHAGNLHAQTSVHRFFLYGTVYDSNDKPIAGAQIRLLKNGGQTVSRYNGRFRLFRPDANDILALTAPGYLDTKVPIDKHTYQLLTIRMKSKDKSSIIARPLPASRR